MNDGMSVWKYRPMLLMHHQQPLGWSKKLTTKLEKPHLMKSIFVALVVFLVCIGCSKSNTQIAEDLAWQYWQASMAKTDSQARRWERSKAVAEAWLVAGNIEKHKEWADISYGDANELDRQQKHQEKIDSFLNRRK